MNKQELLDLFANLKKGLANATYLSMGIFASQVFSFVGVIFVARLFGPEKYGIYTTVIAYVMFFHIFLLSGLSKAIIREGCKDSDSLKSILNRMIAFRLLFICFALLLCIAASFFTNYSPFTKVMIIIFSTELIYFGLDSFLSSIYQVVEKMQYMAVFTAATRFLIAGLSIAFLYLGAGVLVILLVNLCSKYLVLFVNYFLSKKFVTFRFNLRFDLDKTILKAALVFSFLGFVNTFAIKIDVLMISLLSTSSDVGIYSVAHEIARQGIVVRNVLASAFFPIAVKFFYQNRLGTRKIIRYSVMLMAAVAVGCLALSFFIQDIVVLFFGSQYETSGHILRYLIFFLPFAFYSLPFTTYFQASHKESLLLVVYAVAAVTNIPMNLVFFYSFGLIGIAYSTIVVFAVEGILLTFLLYRRFIRRRA